MATKNTRKEIPALKVSQWLDEWDKIEFSKEPPRRKPRPTFYIFKMAASDLKALSGIHKRTTVGALKRSEDLGIQRLHNPDRSNIIGEFVRYGYPWSELSKSKRESLEYEDLRKPGWLPTSIVVNIVDPEITRPGQIIADSDRILVQDESNGFAKLLLPEGFSGRKWKPTNEHPIEVIDGQHRLWAFEDAEFSGDFELPVVAFYGLDISWQAYLFWTINVKPVRINASLAFDLYPLLRTEDWLEKFEGPAIYRETRAQELVELLWSYPNSPWYQRINMLGEPSEPFVSQAAWVRSLIATYIKSWESRRNQLGGLFGAKLGSNEIVLPWTRIQQAAFLITMWKHLETAIADCKYVWAKTLRKEVQETLFKSVDSAFGGKKSLLNTDQGVRSVLNITNDLFYIKASELGLVQWKVDFAENVSIQDAINSLNKEKQIIEFLRILSIALAKYDWRTADANLEDLNDNDKTMKKVFRGSGGYKELRRQVLLLLMEEKDVISLPAKQVFEQLGY